MTATASPQTDNAAALAETTASIAEAAIDAGVLPAPPEEKEDDENVLDLVSIAPTRRLVRVPTKDKPEGQTFELRLMDDFGIMQQQELLSWGRRYDALFNKEEDLTDDERLKLKHYLDCIFDTVLDAPKAVKKTMPDGVRNRVVTAFTLAPLLARQEADRKEAEKAAQENPQTSES